MEQLQVQVVKFRKVSNEKQDYICISDIAKNIAQQRKANSEDLIKSWIRSKDILEFLGVWEKINNVHFNLV